MDPRPLRLRLRPRHGVDARQPRPLRGQLHASRTRVHTGCVFTVQQTGSVCIDVVGQSSAKITYHFFHWKKGTPFADDQGMYNTLTWWEQMDSGKQLTRNRKFLTAVPVVLYLIASHTTDYQHPMLFLNTLAVTVLVVAKLPNMHKVRIFGINAGS
ncbi:unnamed protein product [Urochloa decumbens]|uniref:ORMDL family protein n=1 Tax=Urochloa decumbens TaxID=240449 RepID=A0ABC9F5Y1_9POAL